MGSKPHISNVEWGLVIGALFAIDAGQALLDLFAIGLMLNRFIDIGVGMGLAFYLQIRGQSMANGKRLGAMIGTFLIEQIPLLDALPLWGLDGIYNMVLAKAEERAERALAQVPGGQAVTNKVTPINSKKTQTDTNDIQKAA